MSNEHIHNPEVFWTSVFILFECVQQDGTNWSVALGRNIWDFPTRILEGKQQVTCPMEPTDSIAGVVKDYAMNSAPN